MKYLIALVILLSGPAHAEITGFLEGANEQQRHDAAIRESQARTALIRQCTDILQATGKMPQACVPPIQQAVVIEQRKAGKPEMPPRFRCEPEPPNGMNCWSVQY